MQLFCGKISLTTHHFNHFLVQFSDIKSIHNVVEQSSVFRNYFVEKEPIKQQFSFFAFIVPDKIHSHLTILDTSIQCHYAIFFHL